MTEKLLYTPEEFSQLTGVPTETLSYWRKNNDGPPYVKLGRAVRYPHKAITQFIERNTHDPAKGQRRRK
jgi:predicted DNA-binding transcriptional regulator AlpA